MGFCIVFHIISDAIQAKQQTYLLSQPATTVTDTVSAMYLRIYIPKTPVASPVFLTTYYMSSKHGSSLFSQVPTFGHYAEHCFNTVSADMLYISVCV